MGRGSYIGAHSIEGTRSWLISSLSSATKSLERNYDFNDRKGGCQGAYVNQQMAIYGRIKHLRNDIYHKLTDKNELIKITSLEILQKFKKNINRKVNKLLIILQANYQFNPFNSFIRLFKNSFNSFKKSSLSNLYVRITPLIGLLNLLNEHLCYIKRRVLG